MTAKEKIEGGEGVADEKLAARLAVAAETKLIVDPNKIFNDLVESENKEAKEEIFALARPTRTVCGRKQKLTKAQSAQLNQKRILQQKQQREAILAKARRGHSPSPDCALRGRRSNARAEAMKDKPLIDIQLNVGLAAVSSPLPSLPF